MALTGRQAAFDPDEEGEEGAAPSQPVDLPGARVHNKLAVVIHQARRGVRDPSTPRVVDDVFILRVRQRLGGGNRARGLQRAVPRRGLARLGSGLGIVRLVERICELHVRLELWGARRVLFLVVLKPADLVGLQVHRHGRGGAHLILAVPAQLDALSNLIEF